MEKRQVDVAIVGAGTAGLNARRECEKAGVDWVMIESGAFGTTCARVGCMPSKLLIAAAESAHEVARSGLFGVEVDSYRINGPRVLERVRSERDRFVGFVVDAVEDMPRERIIRGHARFVDPKTLQVDDHTLVEADRIVLATGSSPWLPPQFREFADHVLTSDDLFEMEDLPESMAVIGTGVIGLELGQALSRLGVEVDFFNPFDELGPFTDPKIMAEARRIFGQKLNLHLKTQITDVERRDEGFRFRWVNINGKQKEQTFAKVLVAAGRRANVQNIDIEKSGIPLDDKNEPINDERTMQAGGTSIFVAGDASCHRPLLHEASDEGRIAGFNAAHFPHTEARLRKPNVVIAFTDPQIAIIGSSFADLDPDRTEIGEVSYANQGRARVMGINEGLVRLYADRDTCKLVGAEMLGPRVEHTAHLLVWAIHNGTTVPELLTRPFYHPVIEEGIRTALRDLAKGLRVTGHCPPESFGDSPGA